MISAESVGIVDEMFTLLRTPHNVTPYLHYLTMLPTLPILLVCVSNSHSSAKCHRCLPFADEMKKKSFLPSKRIVQQHYCNIYKHNNESKTIRKEAWTGP